MTDGHPDPKIEPQVYLGPIKIYLILKLFSGIVKCTTEVKLAQTLAVVEGKVFFNTFNIMNNCEDNNITIKL